LRTKKLLDQKIEENIILSSSNESLESKVTLLEEINISQSEGYELFKSEYEKTILSLSSQLEYESKISDNLMEEYLVSKINANKIQETYKDRLKIKKTVTLKEFLESK